MHTNRLTRTRRRASCRDPAARLVDTTAGSSCGVIPTATGVHDGAHQGARVQLGERGAARDRLRALRHRQGLAGHRTLVALQPGRGQQAHVRGYDFAEAQRDDVTRHQVTNVEVLRFARPQHDR